MYKNKPDCEINDKAACFNTKTVLKSLQLTLERLKFCFEIIIENIKYHFPEIAEFLMIIVPPKVNFSHKNIENFYS